MHSESFYLRPAPPFRLDLTVWALRRMPQNIIDRWDGRTYQRVLSLTGMLVKVNVRQPDRHRVLVQAEAVSGRQWKKPVTRVIEKMLGIRTDLSEFNVFASRTAIGALANDFLGFKPPRFPTVYEGVINAIACQQISLNVCIVLLNRLSEAWGRPWNEDKTMLRSFPLAGDLATASVPELRSLGFSSSKARAVIAVSQEVTSGRLDLEGLEGKPDAEVMEVLTGLPGIGPWSAEYVMLRGLGRTHIFPGSDSGALRSLQLLLDLKERPDAAAFMKLTRPWHPFAGLVYFHFLLNKLRSRGILTDTFARAV